MVGAKGARGPPGPPGKCSCGSLGGSPSDDYTSRGSYPKVPAVRINSLVVSIFWCLYSCMKKFRHPWSKFLLL